MAKWVYAFGDGKAEGKSGMRDLLGGKGANLAEMANLGLPVPPGFTITTEVCTYFYDHDQHLPAGAERRGRGRAGADGPAGRPRLRRRRQSAARLGALRRARLHARHDGHRPQSRPQRHRRSMRWRRTRTTSASPGTAIAASSRCIRMSCSTSTITISRTCWSSTRTSKGYSLDTDLTAADWQDVIGQYKAIVERELGKPFPQDPREQLWGAIGAVFGSWMNQRAITYRRLHDIPASWGTAVNVQAMVFGNMGDTSATGVAFTRNPSTGEHELYGEFLVNAQGEDVVAGIRTPQNITEAARIAAKSDKPSMETVMPEVFAEFRRTTRTARKTLSRHAGHGVHRRARQTLDAADAQRQAHRESLAQDRRRHGERGADLARGRRLAHRAAVARPAAASDHRSEGASATIIATRSARLAGRGLRQHRLQFRRSRAAARPAARRSSWCASRRVRKTFTACTRRRHSHDARRHDVPCGGRRARHGQALRVRRRHDPRRLQGRDDDDRRQDAEEGRCRHDRRLDRPGDRRRGRDDPAGTVRRFRHADGMGGQGRAVSACAPTPTRPPMRASRGSSARKASACAAPSICSSRATASSPCAR